MITKDQLRNLAIGEKIIVPIGNRTVQSIHLELNQIKREFCRSNKDYEFKTRKERFGVTIQRVAKSVDSRRYAVIYEINPKNRQTLFPSLPYVTAKKKEYEYKRNSNFKTGKIIIELCK